MRNWLIALTLCGTALLSACPGEAGNLAAAPPLKGQMYYGFAGRMYRLNLSTGAVQKIDIPKLEVLGSVVGSSYFDVSLDNRDLVLFTRPYPDVGDCRFVNIVSSANVNEVRSRFKFCQERAWFKLSPDKTKVAAAITYFDTKASKERTFVRIVDRAGKTIAQYTVDDAGNDFQEMSWLPDGNLVMSTAYGLFKTDDTSLLHATRTFTPKFDKWGFISVSPNGQRVAFRANRHIWTSNLDGSKLTQVTDSEGDAQEFAPQWSPDGTRLAFRARIFAYTLGGPVQGGGSLDLLVVVPADGKTYALNKNYLRNVSSVTNGTEEIVGVNGVVVVKQKDERGKSYNVPVENDVSWR
ncbi:MAG: hypothetical protein HC933_03275 [Pleurocapsa sp. SU_196_0]|nr:hypothetical protein [Pleurocapsa sp. SU_196_0]